MDINMRSVTQIQFSSVKKIPGVVPNPHEKDVKFSYIESSWVKLFSTSEIDFVCTSTQKFPINTLGSLYSYNLFLKSLYFSQTP